MTNLEYIKSLSTDEFAAWLEQIESWDDNPWINWWNITYCKNCESEKGTLVDSGVEIELAWCELHDKCRFFKDKDKIPDCKEIIKLWLNNTK